MLGTASVDQELIVEVSSLVTLSLVSHINGEVFPVSLHKMMTQGIHIVILRPLPISLIPASLIGDSIIRHKTLGLVVLFLVVGFLCCIVNWCIGGLIKCGLIMNNVHFHAQVNMCVFAVNFIIICVR